MLDPGLLEELPVGWQKALQAAVDITELTQVSLVLSAHQGLVLTNRAVYILQERWLGKVGCRKIPREQVRQVRMEGEFLCLEHQGGVQNLVVATDKKKQALQAARRIKGLT